MISGKQILALGTIGAVILGGAGWLARRAAAGPVTVPQPMAFSHRVHADKEIACGYCHAWASEYRTAGMPGVEACATCHKYLPKSEDTSRLLDMAERGEQIRWNRVYRLPRFSRFTHGAHARAGVECVSCHGDVAGLDDAVLLVNHDMDRCVDCHARTGADNDCLTCHL